MMRITAVLLTLLGLVTIAVMADLAVSTQQIHSAYAKAESKCIARHISYKVPRKDITTKDGRCYVSYMVVSK